METRVVTKLSKDHRRLPLVTSTEDFRRLETRLDNKIKTAIDKVNEVSSQPILLMVSVDDQKVGHEDEESAGRPPIDVLSQVGQVRAE
jgi:hypothetical protein